MPEPNACDAAHTTAAASAAVEREVLSGLGVLLKYNYAKTTHLTRFVDRNAAELGSPRRLGTDSSAIHRSHLDRSGVKDRAVLDLALAMATDPRLLVPVLSQPSLPFPIRSSIT